MTEGVTPTMNYAVQRFLFLTLDPVHIGTGGSGLGRVDMTIAREPGTRLPKIPGTSLAGVARTYAARRYGKPDAAGQQKRLSNQAKKSETCPIMYTFGAATEAQSGRAGTVSIGDARILLFPVSSVSGPLWVSTSEILEEAGFTVSGDSPTKDTVVTSLQDAPGEGLNLGWLMFDTRRDLVVDPPSGSGPVPVWDSIKERIALVPADIFGEIVNSNLEVRTSVAIDPLTGAAEEGALFTYEAIPRATWLWGDVVEDDYRGKFPAVTKTAVASPKNGDHKDGWDDDAGESLGQRWNRPLDVVRAGLALAEYLGVGGMGTRGFGRIKIAADWLVHGTQS
jgi:CRISPR-associated protein Cmr4